MKRGLEEMSGEISSSKKTKTVSNGELHNEQWTKVEKKRKKKMSKAESKMDVCIVFLGELVLIMHKFLPVSNYLLMRPYFRSNPQNAHPRFMYSNIEIVKRHHAITIDVSF